MSKLETERWNDGDASRELANLLGAARGECAPAGARDALHAALADGSAMNAVAGTEAFEADVARRGTSLLGKFVVGTVATIGAAVVIGGMMHASTSPSPETAVAPAPMAMPVVQSPVPASSPPASAPVISTPQPSAHTPPVAAESSTLSAEIQALADARAANAAKAWPELMHLSQEYASKYPKGSFGPEMRVFYIESLANTGHEGPALANARLFLAGHPEGALRTRTERIVQELEKE